MARHTGTTLNDPTMADVLQGAGDVVDIAEGTRCCWTDEDGVEQHCTVSEFREDGMVRIKFGREARWVEAAELRTARRRMVFKAPGEPTMNLEPNEDDLCYQVTKWPRMLWNDYRDQAPNKIDQVTKMGAERAPRWPDFMRELFARLLNPHTPKIDPVAEGAKWAQQAHDQASDLPAWQRLADAVDGDEMNAGLGAVAVAETLAKEMKPRESNVDMEEIKQRLESLKSMEEMGVDVGSRIERAEQELADAQEEAERLASGMDPTVIRQALRAACEQATEEIDNINKLTRAFTWGTQPGVPTRQNMEARLALANLLKGNPKLMEIAKKLGRLRRIADEKQRTKTNKARDEIHDVEQGADLERLLPSEAMQLAGDDEALAMNAFTKFTERRLLQYALRGKEKEGRGPIVLCFDESGSMNGDPDVWQKAAGLALMDVAVRQRRSWAAIHFDSQVHRIDLYEGGECCFMDYPHGNGNPTVRPVADVGTMLLDTCSHFTGGGTSFDKPLNAAIQCIEQVEYQRADIIMITDGQAPLTDKFCEDFIKVKERKEFKLYVVLVGTVDPGQVKKIADHVWTYKEVMEDDSDFNDRAYAI